MARGITAYAANKCLDAMGNATSFNIAGGLYVKLHTGDPGAAGTTNAATETTRKAVSFGAASGGIMLNDAQVQWTSIAGTQDATDGSIWDDVSAGNCIATGTITANGYTAGDTYTVAIGALSISLTIAA